MSSPFHLDSAFFLDFFRPHQIAEGDLLEKKNLPGLKPSNCTLFWHAEAGRHQDLL